MPEPVHPEVPHPEGPSEKDPLGRHELLKSHEMKEEIDYREKTYKTMYQSVAKFIGTGEAGPNVPSQHGVSLLQTQFNDVNAKTKVLGIAKEASSKLFIPESHTFATFAEAHKPIEFLQKTLTAKGPKCLKAISATISLLALARPDPVDTGKLDRGRLVLGTFISDARDLSNLGGVDTVRYNGLNRAELTSLRASLRDGPIMDQFVSYLNHEHEGLIMKDWVTWPDLYMWTAVDKMIQQYPNESVFTESTTLMNLITHMSPMTAEVEQPDTLKHVLDITIEAMTKQMDVALADKQVPPEEAYKKAFSAAFDALGKSWPIDTSEQLMYHDLTGKFPPRQTAGRAMAIAGAVTAEKYGLKTDV